MSVSYLMTENLGMVFSYRSLLAVIACLALLLYDCITCCVVLF